MGFKDKLSKTINAAADKSAEFAGIAKVKLEVSNKKSSIDKLYKELGELVYGASKSDADVSEEIKSFCDELDKLIEAVEVLEASLIK